MAVFPTGTIGYSGTELQKTSNLGNSTLSTAITSSSTTFTVASATNVTPWPTTNFPALIGTELIFCTSRSGNVCTIGTRAFGGTVQADHNIADVVLVVLSSVSIEAAYQELIAIENVLRGVTAASITITGNIAVTGTVDGRDVSTDGTKLDTVETSAQNNTVTNVGTGAGGVYKQKVGSQIQLKTIKAGTNVTVTNNTDDITIASTDTGEVNTASNVGTGTGTLFKQKTGVNLEFKTLLAGTGVTLTNNASEVQIDATGAGGGEVNTASNLGTGADGEGLFTTKNGVDLPFKRIKAGTNITLTPSTNSVEIAVTGAGAPNDAQYLTLATNGSLTGERTFTVGNGLSGSDAGANSTYTLSALAGNGITVNGSGINIAATVAGNGLTHVAGVLDIVPTSGSNLVANANDLDWTGVATQKAGTLAGTRPTINFIEGTNVTITAADNAGSDRVDVTINASSGTTDAPVGAQYITLATDGTLTAERVLVAGTGLTLTDGGANGNATLNVVGTAGITANANDVAVDLTFSPTWTGTHSFQDTKFFVRDVTDGTKRVKFDVGGTTGIDGTITTAFTTAKTVTLPDATDTLVGKATTDTFTNKTITNTNNNVAAKSLHSATTVVDVSAATAPSSGQGLVATSSTTATWQDVATQAELTTHESDTSTHGVSTVAGISETQTFTNKTLTSSTNVLGGVTMTLGSDATGDVYYRTGGVLTRLGVGSTGHVLTVASGIPSWAAPTGGAPKQRFLSPASAILPNTNFPNLVKNTGTNLVYYELDYDATTSEAAYWNFDAVDATNLTITVYWSTGATTGDVVWEVTTRSIGDGSTWDSAGTTTDFTADTAKGTANQVNEASLTLTAPYTAGQLVQFKLARDTGASDTIAGDVRLLGIKLVWA